MEELWMLSEAQMRRIEPHFPLSHGMPRVDDRRVISGIIFVIRNGLRWRDAIDSATRSKSCSVGSRTGAASTPVTINALMPSSRRSPSPQPSSSGCRNES